MSKLETPPTANREAPEASAGFVVKAFHAIANAKDQSGSVPCPKCGGSLSFAKAPGNGHIRAACSTPDCLRFMQ